MAFTVVEGKLSPLYDHFNDYNFRSCIATDTRLMGVVAMRLTWTAKDGSRDTYNQIIHLDYSEYGIDEYREFFIPSSGKEKREKAREFQSAWGDIAGNLGGIEVEISLTDAIHFIDESLAINENHYKSHGQDLQEFRQQMLMKSDQIHKAAAETEDPGETRTEREYMDLLSPASLSAYETINYFIMRLADNDLKAASYLSDLSEEDLSRISIARRGILSLMRNKISSVKGPGHKGPYGAAYTCRSVFMGEKYYYALSSLEVYRHSASSHKYKVSQFSCDLMNSISDYEAAMQLRQPEYITVFKINGSLADFDLTRSVMVNHAAEMPVPAGMIYMLYNDDNSHVNTNDYRLNHDMYGAYLVSNMGEVIVMSQQIMKISFMEMDLMSGALGSELELEDRYKFTNQIFRSFANTSGLKFKDVIESYE